MKRKKRIIRGPVALLLCLFLAATFTMPVSVLGQDTDVTRYYNVNLFDYDQEELLKALEEKYPGEKPQIFEPIEPASGDSEDFQVLIGSPEPDYSRMFMFMNGRGAAAAPDDRAWFSKWEKDHYVYQGLVRDELNWKDRPEYADGILGIDLFNPKEKKNYKAYKNVPFEFNYDPDTGFYSYSSDKNSATFDSEKYEISLGDPIKTGKPAIDGFRPFGSKPESSPALDHFGMSMEVEFYIPESGPEGLKFNFSGDDDVWVFVDDELVLDLGGIHGALGGTVAFEGNRAIGTIQQGAKIFRYEEGARVDENDGSLEVSGDFGPGKIHTLNFFYLERGGNASNCSIKFNIPPTTTDFAFIKIASDTEERLPGATFRLSGKDSEGAAVNEEAKSDEEGIVRFVGIPAGEYTLKEIGAPEGYRDSDKVYLIRVVPWEPLPSLAKAEDDEFGLVVWYAEEPVNSDDPLWMRLTHPGDLYVWNDPIPVSEEHVLTIEKVATGNRAPIDAEYEFMIQFFDEQNEEKNYYRVVDRKAAEGEAAAQVAGVEILNLTDIDTEWQEGGDYPGYYRFVLKNGQQIAFNYGSYFAQDNEMPKPLAEDIVAGTPALKFHLIETDSQGAPTTTIATAGEFGTEMPVPVIDGKNVEGSLGGDSEDVVITYTNAFGNKDRDKDKDRDRDRDKEKDKDKEDSPVIPADPMQPFSAPEATALATPAPPLPKTGGLGVGLFLGIGSLIAGAGIYLRRR